MVRLQFIINRSEYEGFLADDTDIQEEITCYLENKSYSRDIADIVISALSNATAVSVIMYRRESNESFVGENYISPNSSTNLNGTIHLLKIGDHYEPTVSNSFNKNTTDLKDQLFVGKKLVSNDISPNFQIL